MDWVEIALLSVVGVLLVVEALSLLSDDRPITGAMRADARLWSIWPWGLGLLAAHFWSPWRSPAGAWILVVAVGLSLLGRDVFLRRQGLRHPAWVPAAALILGLASGLLWSRGY